MTASRAERAHQLRDYFDLQLRFAAAMADAADMPLPQALLRYTNLHRRLALGHLGSGPPHPDWLPFAARLTALPDHAARLACTLDAYASAGDEPPPPNREHFGAFAFNPPDDHGVVRIHFSPDDHDGISPLALEKTDRRRSELAALVTRVVHGYPDARRIRGTSWLYHVSAYRRLFPPAYADSATLNGPSLRYEGTANWGQFLSHRGGVKAGAVARMLENLRNLDVQRPWLAFPLPALTPEATVAVFVDHYGPAG
jgi:hypothetical protein